MKAVATILLFASSIHAMFESNAGYWVRVRNCKDKTITAHMAPLLTNVSIEPCVSEVGPKCFKPRKMKRKSCAKKFAASEQCPAVWPMIAEAFGAIYPPCEFARASTAEIAQLPWAQFTLKMYSHK